MKTFKDWKACRFQTMDNHKYLLNDVYLSESKWNITHVELIGSQPIFRQKVIVPVQEFLNMISDETGNSLYHNVIRLNTGALVNSSEQPTIHFVSGKHLLGCKLRSSDRRILGRIKDFVMSLEDRKVIDLIVKAPYKWSNGKEFVFSPLMIETTDLELETIDIRVRRNFLDHCPSFDPTSYDYLYRKGLMNHYQDMSDRMSSINRRINNYGVYKQAVH